MSFVARCFQRRLARRAAIQMVCCELKILHSEQNPGPSVAPISFWGEHIRSIFLSPSRGFVAWPLELGLGTHNPRFVAWPLELGLGTHNPRFVAWPLELGLGAHNPRFVAWPLELGLGTHNPRFFAWPLELGLGTHNPRHTYLRTPKPPDTHPPGGMHVVVVGRAQAPPPWETPPRPKSPPYTPQPTPPRTTPSPPPPRVLKDSWGVGRIRTGCSHPPVREAPTCEAVAPNWRGRPWGKGVGKGGRGRGVGGGSGG